MRIGLPNSMMRDGLLQSSLIKECHVTAIPAEWYSEREMNTSEGEGEGEGEGGQMRTSCVPSR